MELSPRISVIIAAYRPGDAFATVMDSLDAQSLPQAEFETIVIDDGSPDDTFAMLQRYAATRPNMRIETIPNSGWPSLPRNIGTRMAAAPYVLFMDHDDSLFPDALKRLAEYAEETGADIVSPKESKTSDVWWGISSLTDGNIPDAAADGGIGRLLPMVPHKVYRKEFLQGRGVSFPEGRRQLWEDIYVNVEAYRKADRVAVLADTPAYLWHSSTTNNSKTYGPGQSEYWDRLDDLFAFIDRTLDGPEFAAARETMMVHQFRDRVVGRLSAMVGGASPDALRIGMERGRRLQEQYAPPSFDAALGAITAARSALLRADRPDLIAALFEFDKPIGQATRTTAGRWDGDVLELDIRTGWRRNGPLPFRKDGDRVLRRLPAEIEAALPESVLDVTDTLGEFELVLGLRSTTDSITWPAVVPVEARFSPRKDGDVELTAGGTVRIDTSAIAGGQPLPSGSWAVHVYTRWLGVARRGRLVIAGDPVGMRITDGRALSAYRDATERLSIGIDDPSRSPLIDGAARFESATGGMSAFSIPVPRTVAVPAERRAAALVLTAHAHRARQVADVVVRGELAMGADGSVFEGRGAAAAGVYRVAVRTESGDVDTGRMLTVRHDGSVRFEVAPPVVVVPPVGERLQRGVRRLASRGRGVAKRVVRRIQRRGQ